MMNDLLKLEGVHTHIGAYHILHGVDLAVPRGQLTLLLGRNGAGKTTTLRTIMGLWQASQGRITFNGEDITALNTPAIAHKKIAYVPENMGIFADLTVKENMLLAARSARSAGQMDEQRLQWIFGLFPAVEKFWNHPAGKLSGGQKQRLGIARAIVADAPILILDDALSNIDAHTANDIVQRLSAARRGKTTIMVSQKISAVRHLDTILVIADGVISEQGTHAELIARQGLYHQLYDHELKAH